MSEPVMIECFDVTKLDFVWTSVGRKPNLVIYYAQLHGDVKLEPARERLVESTTVQSPDGDTEAAKSTFSLIGVKWFISLSNSVEGAVNIKAAAKGKRQGGIRYTVSAEGGILLGELDWIHDVIAIALSFRVHHVNIFSDESLLGTAKSPRLSDGNRMPGLPAHDELL